MSAYNWIAGLMHTFSVKLNKLFKQTNLAWMAWMFALYTMEHTHNWKMCVMAMREYSSNSIVFMENCNAKAIGTKYII